MDVNPDPPFRPHMPVGDKPGMSRVQRFVTDEMMKRCNPVDPHYSADASLYVDRNANGGFG